MQSVAESHLRLGLFVAWYLVWFADASFGQQSAEWGPYRGANVNGLLTESDVKDFAALGGNLLRANFAFRPLMKKTPPYALDDQMLGYLDRLLDWCEENEVHLVIDPHTTPGMSRNTTTLPQDEFWKDLAWHEHLIRLWDHLARRYATRGDVVAGYDLLNEPSVPNGGAQGTPADYNLLVSKLVETIRRHDKVHTIIIEPPSVHPRSKPWPASWLPEAFAYLEPPPDENVAYSPHMYWPGNFTHQGVGGRPGGLVPYPGTMAGKPLDRDALRRVLEPARRFGDEHDVPILIGEFSAPRWIGDHGNRYIRDVIDLAEEQGWSWAYHSFRAADVWDAEKSNTDRADRARKDSTPRLEILKSNFARNKTAR